jgi:hypothetical protein
LKVIRCSRIDLSACRILSIACAARTNSGKTAIVRIVPSSPTVFDVSRAIVKLFSIRALIMRLTETGRLIIRTLVQRRLILSAPRGRVAR